MTKARHQIANCDAAIQRGLDFIYRFGNQRDNFASYGSFLICCFALVGATSRDPKLRQPGRTRARQLARRWSRAHSTIPPAATPDLILDFILVNYGLSRIRLPHQTSRAQLKLAVEKFSTLELLGFEPRNEPPPSDLPYACDCGLKNERGRKICRRCKRRLSIQSRYRVWMEALANTYVGERCGAKFGARYADVLQWLPAMRPYPVGDQDDALVSDAIYAVTHVVYTLNDYGTYNLSPRWLRPECAFLKANVEAACLRHDAEMLGELLDSLKAFGLPTSHPLIDRGTRYLLAEQNADGSWGDPAEENIRTRCHTTWTAIDGLRTSAWRGERLSLKAVKPLLKDCGGIFTQGRS
jgi:hypothetical protein